ncbi:hypothetical protein EYF80_028542 [Liparis tanakae]|uniref:Uncharacterized protein n=1 Tax=Liparis tanakae TaxID=230148 RepID=A0A4Z2H5U4_9TELE|nr:hypothetical protein EYF80_028542 [Liparis tanakae]
MVPRSPKGMMGGRPEESWTSKGGADEKESRGYVYTIQLRSTRDNNIPAAVTGIQFSRGGHRGVTGAPEENKDEMRVTGDI